MTRVFVTIGFLTCLGTAVRADVTYPGAAMPAEIVNPNDLTAGQFNPSEAVAPTSIIEGPGVQIGEGTVLRPVFGVEGGYISNVFYANTNVQAAGVLRLLAQVGISSLGGARLVTTQPVVSDTNSQPDLGSFVYRASLRASYDFLFGGGTGTDQVSQAGGLGLGASLHALANPMGSFSFGIDEDFVRQIRAADFETSSNLNRDDNTAQLTLVYHPHDRTIGGYLYYRNFVDIFEQSQQAFTDRMTNTVGLHPMWQWLPQTQVYVDASISVVSAIGSGPKSTSYPLVTYAGLSTLLTPEVSANVMAGYTNGFYSNGPSFSAPLVGADLGYSYSPLGRVALGYQLAYQDSINANYYRDHMIYATLQQLFSPFVLMVRPELHFREYNGISVTAPQITGPDTRDDVLFSIIAGIAYTYRNWLAATLNYEFIDVSTDYRYTLGTSGPIDPSYVDHEILAGLRIAM